MTQVPIKKKLLKEGIILSLANIGGKFSSLIRNIIIARIISPEHFGIASTLVMAVSFLEMVSDFSLDRLLVQAKDGDTPQLQYVAQLLQLIRGIILFLAFFLGGETLASLFSIPEASHAFRYLAIIPLLNGLVHLDIKRIQRDFNFWKFASIELTALLIMLACTYPVTRYFPDYHAMLILLILKSTIILFGSHICSQRKFQIIYDKEIAKRFFSFGWPLLINGILLFAITQGDRFILASSKAIFSSNYTMTDVGYFSAALSLTMLPAMTVVKIVRPFFLPILSHPSKVGISFERAIKSLNDILVLIACCLSIFLVFFGDKLFILLYGVNYISAAHMISWMAIMWTMRCLRSLQVSIAMSQMKNKLVMHMNLFRFCAILGSAFVIWNNYPLVVIIYVGITLELLTNIFIVLLNYYKINISFHYFFKGLLVYLFFVTIAKLSHTLIYFFPDHSVLLCVSSYLTMMTILLVSYRKKIAPLLTLKSSK